MPLYRNLDTNIVDDLPEYVIGTPLGARYEPYTPDEEVPPVAPATPAPITPFSVSSVTPSAIPAISTDLKDQANAG